MALNKKSDSLNQCMKDNFPRKEPHTKWPPGDHQPAYITEISELNEISNQTNMQLFGQITTENLRLLPISVLQHTTI